MSLDPQTWRPAPIFPRARGGEGAGFVLAAALISLIAVGAMAWLSADLRARPAIAARLMGGATIAVMGSAASAGLESVDAAAWRAREILAHTPGVQSAHVLAPAPGDADIAEAMGAKTAPARLIAVAFLPRAAPRTSAMMRALRREGLTGEADDHGPTSGPVERALTLDALGLAAIGAFLILLVTFLTAVRVQARARRLTRRMSLLSGLGMTDGSLLTELLQPVVWSAGLAAIVGGVIGLLVIRFAALRIPGIAPLIPPPDTVDLTLAAAWPPVAMAVSGLISFLTGRERLKKIAP